MQILLVQEKQEVSEKIGFFLESRYGVKVQEVSSAEAALAELSNETPVDLVIWDCAKGPEAILRAVREKIAKLPVIVCVQGTPAGPAMSENIISIVERTRLIEGVVSAMDS